MSKRAIRVGHSPVPSQKERFFLEAMADTYEIRKRKRMYGSGAAFCPRQNFLNAGDGWVGQEGKMSADSRLYMSVGNGIEEGLTLGLESKGRLFFNNLYLPKCNPDVGGKIDLVYLGPNDEIAISEVKTTGKIPNEPKTGHIEQLMTYAVIGGYDIGNVLYVGRNVRDRNGIIIKQFDQEITEETMMPYATKICYSQLAINEGWLPEIPVNFRKSRHCGYCTFKDFCWGEAEVPSGETFVSLSGEEAADRKGRAEEWAKKLIATRPERYVSSLRHLWRNVDNKDLRPRLVEEITKYEPF